MLQELNTETHGLLLTLASHDAEIMAECLTIIYGSPNPAKAIKSYVREALIRSLDKVDYPMLIAAIRAVAARVSPVMTPPTLIVD